MTERTAVVLFNLGGPESVETVKPFLTNLFADPAILRVPWPVRPLLARLIAQRRTAIAEDIYRQLGGGSPLLANTQAQADALTRAIGEPETLGVFVAMRYWRPRAAAVARAVAAFAPQRVILLPLYPQFSTTTTSSSATEWQRAAQAAGLTAPTRLVCCYPDDGGFVTAVANHVRTALRDSGFAERPRVLFSAHGLPKRVVAAGDPYQWQVERTVAAVVAELGIAGLDWALCYQSRVGPLAWISPSIDDEIRRAGADRVPVVVCPIAFVSEHSETLVELDVEYRGLATQMGVPRYVRTPTVGSDPGFIDGLARLVRDARAGPPGACSGAGRRLCPAALTCAMAGTA